MAINYLENPWKPKPYSVFKDNRLAEHIYNAGFRVEEAIPTETIQALKELFFETHNFEGNEKGGMFYSVYSQNLAYRKQIHEKITSILRPFLEHHFTDYRVMLGSFVVKISGPESEFYLHQDTTGLDEELYSPMSLWIPLDDVNQSSGCLGILPHSHHFFTPYRSISFPAPFDHIQSSVKQYIQPLPMTAGEVLLFDNRILHNSYINSSGKERIAVVLGIFPKDAPMLVCHKPEYVCGGEVELIEQDDDFLFTYPNFLIDCQKRPEVGRSLGVRPDPYPEISVETFELLCEKYGLAKQTEKMDASPISCQLISEPQPSKTIEKQELESNSIDNKNQKTTFVKKISKLIGL